MSSHDCKIAGTISIKDGVKEKQVKQALKAFLDEHGLSYKKEKAEENIQFDGNSLFLSLDIFGNGGYQNDSVDALAASLASVVDGWGYFEFRDFDTGSSDEACTPYFVAPDSKLEETARLMYGIEQMEQWVRPLIGNDAFEALTRQIVNSPRVVKESTKNVKPASKAIGLQHQP